MLLSAKERMRRNRRRLLGARKKSKSEKMTKGAASRRRYDPMEMRDILLELEQETASKTLKPAAKVRCTYALDSPGK